MDDDTLYSPRLLETLLEWQRRLPDAALAFSGWPVAKGSLRYPDHTVRQASAPRSSALKSGPWAFDHLPCFRIFGVVRSTTLFTATK